MRDTSRAPQYSQETPDSLPSKILGFVVGRALLLSPLFGLFLRTIEALDYGYYTRLLTDPGHRHVRIYDRLLTFAAFAVGFFIVFYHNPLWNGAQSSFDIARAVFFPQFTSLKSFIVLYALSSLLFFYDRMRGRIIRIINEKQGVW